jgi:predicted TIM-barrel fold metal-dependent hydrolase
MSANDAFRPDPSWLAGAAEPPLRRDVEIVDSHLHLGEHWDPPFGWDAFVADVGELPVRSAVYVECGWGVDPALGSRAGAPEVARAAELAQTTASRAGPKLAGIVGQADLRSPSIGDDLDALVVAGRGWLKGIRSRVAWDPDPAVPLPSLGAPPHVLQDSDWRQGLRALAGRGLVLDVYAYVTQLDEVVDVAHAVPEARIVVNHLGGPLGVGTHADRVQRDARWRSALNALARCDNAALKLGGIGMSVFGNDFRAEPRPPSSSQLAEIWADRLRWAAELFGTERCMLEGNFPVDKHCLPYSVVWNAFLAAFADASDDDLSELCSGTARRVYSLARS